MRTTINIEDDVLKAIKHISQARSEPLGQVVSAMVRKFLSGAREVVYENDLPVFQVKEKAKPITLEDVRKTRMSEGAFLLDVNVLIALAWPNHVHHVLAKEWFHTNQSSGWRTCPITQSAFIRISSNPVIIEEAATPMEAQLHQKHMTDHPKHRFIPDNADFSKREDISFPLFHSRRQVADYYL